jgi:rhamnosyltransferase
VKNVFIIGSKGIPASYGGFETFVDKLTEKKKNENIKYHVSCLASDNKEFQWNNARCFNVKVRDIGSSKAIVYDIKALRQCIKYIKQNKLKDCIIYILACRIGFFLAFYCKIVTNMGVKIFINPDGYEWKRRKWNKFIRVYWRSSEKLMVKHADLIICDSLEIERYIKEEYNKFSPSTIYIAYGADVKDSILYDNSVKLLKWYKKHHIKENEYYLIVGRFVPENNYEIIVREFMISSAKKDLVIITSFENSKFYRELLEKTKFNEDARIKFVGTVYDGELLTEIREKAYAYFHGHEVGGTNPSLLEALATTKINMLIDVIFNKEVGGEAAVYFSKDKGILADLINKVDVYDNNTINNLELLAKNRIREYYSWQKIVNYYEEVFLSSSINTILDINKDI